MPADLGLLDDEQGPGVLTGAGLTGASLGGANLTRAWLAGARRCRCTCVFIMDYASEVRHSL
ncbi:MAG TPA: hypothetical protein VEH31_08290 [Streptosporangiaceae bacterium]|nr:hypothetical protein [Streptosporangiaceae bacterium]